MMRALILVGLFHAVAYAADAGVSVCGDGILSGDEACDTALVAGSPGACPTAEACAALPAGSNGCEFRLTGSACTAHCAATMSADECANLGSANLMGDADDSATCSAGGGGVVLAIAAAALLVARRARRYALLRRPQLGVDR